jgi:hypothetical protein
MRGGGGSAREPVRAALLAAQNPDGGFPARAGLSSTTEATAVAALALSAEADAAAARRARQWLRAQQRADHGWPVAPEVPESTWVTALAVLALAPHADDADAVRGGIGWLVARRGRPLGEPPGILRRLLGAAPAVELDASLIGWPWVAGTFSWVEPTAYAMLALRAVRPPSEAARARLTEGEALLGDRVCLDGGWNYGNARVLGEDLWSYPDTTALALLALRSPAPPAPIAVRGLDALERMLRTNDSGLATALGALALAAYGRDAGSLRARLLAGFPATQFAGDVRVQGWALRALDSDDAQLVGGADG